MPRGGKRTGSGRKPIPGQTVSPSMAGPVAQVQESLDIPPEFDSILPAALRRYRAALKEEDGYKWLKPLNELFGYFHPRLSASASVKRTTTVQADVKALMVKLLGDNNSIADRAQHDVLDVLVTQSDPAEGVDGYLQPPADPAPDSHADWDVGADD